MTASEGKFLGRLQNKRLTSGIIYLLMVLPLAILETVIRAVSY